MKLILAIAISAFAFSDCLAEPLKTAAASQDDPVVCREPASKTRTGEHLRATPICRIAGMWAQIDARARQTFLQPRTVQD